MFILLFPAVGLASEQAEQPGIFTGDLGNIIWTLITFLAVVFVLGKFAWKPILTALQKREDFIRDSLGQAKQDREAAEALLKQYSEKLEKASEEAGAVVEEARRDAEETRKRIHAEAKSEGEAMV
ncbi:MAG: ATP synthase F0 subunit B, partial [Phycisphaerae bacterium]